MMPRRRSHRVAFTMAGVYNLAWGLHAGIDPDALFRLAGMPPARYPEVWACLGSLRPLPAGRLAGLPPRTTTLPRPRRVNGARLPP